MENFSNYFGDVALYFAAVLVGVIFGALIILNIIRLLLARRRYFLHQIFLVRLPKEKPHDDDKEVSVSQMKEEIAKGETIFSAIGGLKAQRGFMNWLTGRNDQFSFEIVANHNRISFYVAAPYDSARYLEQQIHAHYPQAV
ncbi:MAG: hypothetical protein Q8N57_00055, partial [bacterium]|nr:hypothetical protein [bacterium]